MPRFMKTLNRISRCQALFRQKRVAAPDLHPSHYPFVLAVCRLPGRSQEELARELYLDKSTVARVLACLEKQGYITRRANEADKRQYLVYPTEKMQELWPRVRLANREWSSRIEEGIPEEELAVFHKVLSQMAESAKIIMDEMEKPL